MRLQTRAQTVTAIATIAIACAMVASTACAQTEPRVSIAGTYVFLQQQTSSQIDASAYTFGWMAAAASRISGRWSGAGEFGISYKSNDAAETQLLMGALGGARFALLRAAHVTVFAQGLAGLERFSEPGLSESGLAVQPGGGVDIYLSSRVFIRAQADYRWSQANDTTFHAYRVVAGVGVAVR
jgi:hypothetical protein